MRILYLAASATSLIAFGAATLSADEHAASFGQEIQPFLRSHCVRCHGPDREEGGLRVDRLGPIGSKPEFANVWLELRDRIVKNEMPPKDEPQPAAEQRVMLLDWINEELRLAREASSHTGHVMRRLNRAEYRETLRELLDLHPAIDTARDLPEDDTYHGFDNIGSALNISPVQMRVYVENAARVMDLAFPSGRRPQQELTRILAMDAVDFYRANDAVRAWRQETNGKVIPKAEYERQKKEVMSAVPDVDLTRTIRFGTTSQTEYRDEGVEFSNMGNVQWGGRPAGLYRLRFRVRAIANSRGDLPMLSVTLTTSPPNVDQPVMTVDLTPEFRIYEMEAFAQPHFSTLRFEAAVMGNRYFYKRGAAAPRIMVESLEIEGPIVEDWPSPAWHEYFGGAEDSEEDAREIIARFAEKAFRRPPTSSRMDQFLAFYQTRRDAGDEFETAVKLVMQAILATPEFLFLVEEEPASAEGPQPLDDYELAARLSYFLWSGPPDEELYSLAKTGRLHEEKTLLTQARRMMLHPRAARFAENFTGQWLMLRTLGQMAPDSRKFVEWEETLQESMRKETELFFLHLLQNDLPVTNLIDSDFAMLNGRLAYFYGIEGVSGYEFRRVSLEETEQRGGLLGQASILTLTSDGIRTLPMKRGAFILENLLGDPLPPPPNDVPPVKESTGATLRERLAAHRSMPACASCHAKLDPFGFALENFNAIGKWREKEEETRLPIDASGELKELGQFETFAEFKGLMTMRRDDVARCVSEKLLMYALGRPLDFTDEPVIEAIANRTKEDGYKLSRLVLAIVASDPFRTK
ncbi:DUF1592 domain-containing protein [Lignipirellula cremea]|uniref:DUF1592 domain-containing protein n=1 Tax=Lignipirellula cremea TaxID=2528010 RepID=UPI0018D201D4|nr:DUF1592 domain-containing protein [Lignipirellula cremea]